MFGAGNLWDFLWKVLIGTVMYVLLLFAAAAVPTGAGLMLTFPALNGLALLYLRPERVPLMAQVMVRMPVINGACCAAYILLFLWVGRTAAPSTVAWGLSFLTVLLWVFAVSGEGERLRSSDPLKYATLVTATGLILAAAAIHLARTTGFDLQETAQPQ